MNETNFRPFVLTMRIIHLALAVGQMLFLFIVLFVLKQEGNNQDQSFENFLLLFSIIALCNAIILGGVLFNRLLVKAKMQTTLDGQQRGYQTASIVRWALVEGSSLLATVGFLLTFNNNFVIIASISITYFLFLYPSQNKINKALGINHY